MIVKLILSRKCAVVKGERYRLPHPFALQPGLEDGDILDLCRDGLEGIFAKHHEIGAVSGGDFSFGVFLEAGEGSGLGEAVEGFFDGEGLLGQVGGTAVQILPGHGALDAGEDIRGLHRAVGAVADGGTRVQQEIGRASCRERV